MEISLESCKKELSNALNENAILLNAYSELQERYKDQKKQLSSLTPIPFIGKVREEGKKGAPSWPLFVWEMLLEQLVNGTPPTAVTYLLDNNCCWVVCVDRGSQCISGYTS